MRLPRDIFPQLWINGLRSISNPGKKTFKEWILSGSGYAVTALPGATPLRFLIHHEPDFLQPAAVEINVWASSSFESITSITSDAVRANAIAWPLIQLYYSAFFAAHSLMRSFGRICTQFEASHTTALVNSAATIGLVGAVERGLYAFIYDRSLRQLIGTKCSDSHADTWR